MAIHGESDSGQRLRCLPAGRNAPMLLLPDLGKLLLILIGPKNQAELSDAEIGKVQLHGHPGIHGDFERFPAIRSETRLDSRRIAIDLVYNQQWVASTAEPVLFSVGIAPVLCVEFR